VITFIIPAHEERKAHTAPMRSLATPPSEDCLPGFLAIWRDADPDMPNLKEAKAEYAKLQ
jgi:hypothetical protein